MDHALEQHSRVINEINHWSKLFTVTESSSPVILN